MTKQVRDWHKDMELLQKKPRYTIDEVNHIIYNVAPYWLQEVKKLCEVNQQEQRKILGLRIRLNAEKERAEAAETREKKLREALEHCIDQYPLYDSKEVAASLMVDFMNNILSILYPEKGTPQVKPLNNEDMKASQVFINRAMRED